MYGTRGVKAALVIYIAVLMLFVVLKVFQGHLSHVVDTVKYSSSKLSIFGNQVYIYVAGHRFMLPWISSR